MKPRKQIPVDREIVVVDNSQFTSNADKPTMLKAVHQMTVDEAVKEIKRVHGHEPAPFANDPDETVYYDRTILVVRSFRPEDDGEYLNRMRLEDLADKQKEELERNEYLRLKAKYETK